MFFQRMIFNSFALREKITYIYKYNMNKVVKYGNIIFKISNGILISN